MIDLKVMMINFGLMCGTLFFIGLGGAVIVAARGNPIGFVMGMASMGAGLWFMWRLNYKPAVSKVVNHEKK